MATAWHVTGQRPTTVSNGLTYVPAMIVGFKTAGGWVGSIEVPAPDYTEDKVTALLTKAAATMDAIGKLTGPES